MIKTSALKPGQFITWPDLLDARQRLFDTGLYRKVEIRAEDICAKETSVSIQVKEKHYHLIYPRLGRSADGDITRGIAYRASNLFGTDHRLKLIASRKDHSNGETSDLLRLEYDWPLLLKHYHLRWRINTENKLLTKSADNIIEFDRVLDFFAGRDWLSNPFGHPITILLKLHVEKKFLDQVALDYDLVPGYYNTLGVRAEYDDVHVEMYRRFGFFLALEINRGLASLGSDFNASTLELDVRNYHRLNLRDNLNVRLLVSLADQNVFGQRNFDIGGAKSVRGVAPGEIEGNAFYVANIEYVMGVRRWPNIRFSVFSDIGNVFEHIEKTSDRGWQATVGLGMRWKIQSFVNTDLVIDIAHNPETGESKAFGGTALTF